MTRAQQVVCIYSEATIRGYELLSCRQVPQTLSIIRMLTGQIYADWKTRWRVDPLDRFLVSVMFARQTIPFGQTVASI